MVASLGTLMIIFTAFWIPGGHADARTDVVSRSCGKVNATSPEIARQRYSSMLQKMKGEMCGDRKFAISESGEAPDKVYMLSQCMDDLSNNECEACFTQVYQLLQHCLPANGGRVYLDGCFARFENYNFFKEVKGPADSRRCGSDVETDKGFKELVEQVVMKMVVKAPANNGFAEEEDNANGLSAYGIASCWKTLDNQSCSTCLDHAASSSLSCLPSIEGRALNAGCYLRYSYYEFSNSKGSKKEKSGNYHALLYCSYVIYGFAVCVLAIWVGFYLGKITYRRKLRRTMQKGVEVDLSSLHGALQFLQFKYSTIDRATESFCEANKLGRGGYGEVFKTWKHFQAYTVSEIIDNSMEKSPENMEEMKRVVWVGLLCTQESASHRPTMKNVVEMLKHKDMKLPIPSKPPFTDESLSLSDPRISQSGLFCSPNKLATKNFIPTFVKEMETLSQLLTSSHFATYHVNVTTIVPPIYGLAQCHHDLSQTDCLLCFAASRTKLPRCLPSPSARIYLDGCFLRYDNYSFYHESTSPLIDSVKCSSQNATVSGYEDRNRFTESVGYAVGNVTRIAEGSGGFGVVSVNGVYALAQCWESVGRDGCRECLEKAGRAVRGCDVKREGRGLNAGCYLRYSDHKFFSDGGETDNDHESSRLGSIIATVLATFAFVMLFLFAAYVVHARLSKIKEHNNFGLVSPSIKKSYLSFKYETLEKATDYFNPSKKLGQGGSGSVYLGTLPNGKTVASAFNCINVQTFAILENFNFMCLTFVCISISDYECDCLIAQEISSMISISKNIIYSKDASGYMAPEYLIRGQLTEKADVYSFGILILEIVCGRRNNTFTTHANSPLQTVWLLHRSNQLVEAVDPNLKDDFPAKEACDVLRIGLLCTQAAVALRPSMAQVIRMLTDENCEIPVPNQPPFLNANVLNSCSTDSFITNAAAKIDVSYTSSESSSMQGSDGQSRSRESTHK
ncbi:hypothetical protein JRO89_XS01G0237100 [Xanthoceras sorbifolium]|uniref:Gnk2-homologous domain-containing protein n=1 Tax=Xanthoceras sorbifolium TaxID=99658 RepID=A0ABQ8IL56_9ROSI|nr:hypothetical protein JRO89_XS01G0237100 [Xanthoceras sorbifolium]